MRGKKVKQLRKLCLIDWYLIPSPKVGFKTMFRRIRRAYSRGLIDLDSIRRGV